MVFDAYKCEILNIRAPMESDGVGLCEFFSWLQMAFKENRVDELEVHTRIKEARARQPYFVGPSSATIAGFNANGAMPHYKATETSFAKIEGSGLLLIDSDGQYLNGTTDITRMVCGEFRLKTSCYATTLEIMALEISSNSKH